MSGHGRIRAALMTLLQTVPGIGRVHNYERFSKSPQDFQKLYQDGNDILGWYVRRQSYRELPFTSTRNRVRTRWVLQGFAGLVDGKATELAFDNLIDAIAEAVRARPVLYDAEGKGLCHTVTDDGAGLQLEESGPVMFAGVLCHGARFGLTTEHMEQVAIGGSDAEECASPCLRLAIDPVDVQAPASEVMTLLVQAGNRGEGNG